MGYSGKLCIHPGQVALANDAFVPTADEVDRAHRLLVAYEAASTNGVAAIDFEGQMVDEPLAAQARQRRRAGGHPVERRLSQSGRVSIRASRTARAHQRVVLVERSVLERDDALGRA